MIYSDNGESKKEREGEKEELNEKRERESKKEKKGEEAERLMRGAVSSQGKG